jgi:colanic acid biosynthesis glycosyl transferase WcaI
MKILIISQYFWPEDFRINDLAVGLREKGHSVTVLTGIPNYPEGHFAPGYGIFKKRTEHYHGVRIVRVPLVSRGNSNGIRLFLNFLSYAFFASVLGPLYCRDKYDLIFVFEISPVTVGIPATIFKRTKGIPIVFWVLDLWPESLSATKAVRSPKILSLVNSLVRFIYQRCDRILAASRGFIPRIVATGGDPKRIEYFPNWSESLYNPEVEQTTAPDYSDELPEGFRVMFAGNIGAAQSFDTILAAAQKLSTYPDIKWVILGDGRMYDWVKQQVEQKGLANTLFLLGRKPMTMMPGYFKRADVMVVTLKRDPIFALTIPGKIQSYMACAKPIIASLDGEGARLIEESGGGLSCPAEDADALATAVLTMYRMTSADRERMGHNARTYCESNFDRSMQLDKLERWMKTLVTAAQNRPSMKGASTRG